MTHELQRIPTEHEEQRELVRWFRQTYTDVRIFAIPNGSGRSKSAGARLKAEGVSAGVPDLFIPGWRLWIEMKRIKGGSVSLEQKTGLNICLKLIIRQLFVAVLKMQKSNTNL